MKQITLSLSDAQFDRLNRVARLVEVTPERLAVGEIFAGIDGWDDDAGSFLETLESTLEYADTGIAMRDPEQCIEDGLEAMNLIEEVQNSEEAAR